MRDTDVHVKVVYIVEKPQTTAAFHQMRMKRFLAAQTDGISSDFRCSHDRDQGSCRLRLRHFGWTGPN